MLSMYYLMNMHVPKWAIIWKGGKHRKQRCFIKIGQLLIYLQR